MKRIGIMFVVLMACAFVARADVYTWTGACTNGQAATISAVTVPNGMLEKIEMFNSVAGTSTVVVASYAADNTTAVETYATVTLTTPKVVRLRVLPTDNTGTALAAAVSTGTYSNTTTVLNIPYSQAMIGGNLRVSLTGTGPTAAGNTVTIRFFYSPILAK